MCFSFELKGEFYLFCVHSLFSPVMGPYQGFGDQGRRDLGSKQNILEFEGARYIEL